MMCAWEAVTKATQSSDLAMQEYECDLDRVGALAFSPKLGAAMLRWGGGQRSARHAVEVELAKAVHRMAKVKRWRSTDQQAHLLIMRVLHEIEHRLCRKCGGRGMVGGVERYRAPDDQDGVPAICPSCGGGRCQVYDDRSRARALGVSCAEWDAMWRERFVRVRAAVFASCQRTGRALRDQLERGELR